MTRQAHHNQKSSPQTSLLGSADKPVRRVFHCDGMRGTLLRSDSVWSVANEHELRIAAALGGSTRVLALTEALVETLNAGLVDRQDVGDLIGYLKAITAVEPLSVSRVHIPDRFLPAVALACTYLRSGNGSDWLAWALSARLDENLLRNGLPGPGLSTVTHRSYRRYPWIAFERETRWLKAMPEIFWTRLMSANECCKHNDETEPCPGRQLRDKQPELCLRSAAIASDPNTSAKTLRVLARSRSAIIRDLVASHPNLPRKAVKDLETTPWSRRMSRIWPALFRVIQNKQTCKQTLGRLADNRNETVRIFVARHPNVSDGTLRELSRDESAFVRSSVASHIDTRRSVLRRLADDSNYKVRRATATNHACSPDMLRQLLADKRREVRAAAAANPVTYHKMLSDLASDRAMAVRAAVAERPDTNIKVL